MKGLIGRSIGVVAALLVLGVAILWLAGFFNQTIEPTTVAIELNPVDPALAAEVVMVQEPLVEQATGTIVAKNETTIASRILASISKIHVNSGDLVKEGQALVDLDARDLKARLQQAEQSVVSAEAYLKEVRSNHARLKTLQAEKAISVSEFDRVDAELGSAEADLQKAVRLVDEARTAMTFASIKSPIAGRVVERFADPGDLASPGAPLLQIYNPDALRLEANVRESIAMSLKVGHSLTATVDALGQEYEVTIDEIVPSADPGSRSFVIRATLPQTEVLYPGMFGRLTIPSGETERLYVPAEAVSRVGQLEMVYVIDDADGIAITQRRMVRTGKIDETGERIEILSGLKSGERVAVDAVE